MNTDRDSGESPLSVAGKFALHVAAVILLVLLVGWALMTLASLAGP